MALRLVAFARELRAKLLLGRQEHLVTRRQDLLVVLGKRDFDHRIVLVGAQDDADGGRLMLGASK
jgi:hypothetical protein